MQRADGREREVMKAEARFLRAYYYFNLFKQYGPIYLWYDQIADLAIKSEVIDRNTVDECVSFIEKEMYDAAQILPKTIQRSYYLDGPYDQRGCS